ARWAQAWSARDVDAYLAAYAPDFAAPGMTRAAWVAQRRERIAAPQSIEVKISDLKVEQQGDTARATFRQAYRSDRLSSTVTKTLTLAQQNGEWRIVGETSR
ncbi:MAG: YybH family protein, partial [Thiobacillus sp.]